MLGVFFPLSPRFYFFLYLCSAARWQNSAFAFRVMNLPVNNGALAFILLLLLLLNCAKVDVINDETRSTHGRQRYTEFPKSMQCGSAVVVVFVYA